MNYLDYRNLQTGDHVSWEHPVTGKVYDFEVTCVDWDDDWQPVELQLLNDLEAEASVNVSEYSEFAGKGDCRWPYISSRSHKERYGWDIPENSITLERLFYTPAKANSSSESVLAPYFKTVRDLQIPSADEVNQYRYTSQADFQKMFVEQMAKAIKEDEDRIKLPPVLVEMYREELNNLGYRVDFDTVYFVKFD